MIKSSVLYLVLNKGQSYCSYSLANDGPKKWGQCTIGSSLAREYTIKDPKNELLSKGVHLQVPNELLLRKWMKREFQSKKGTTQPYQQGVNVDHEKSLGNFLYDGIDIYIYIYI